MLKNSMEKILVGKRHPELVWLVLPKFQFRAKCPMSAGPQEHGINTPNPALTYHKTFTGCFARQSRKGRWKNGFTLAEVLITLGIIGVVAAMTIPTLMQKTQEKDTVVALKKTYSTLQNAYNLAVQNEGGTPDTWDTGIFNIFTKYLKLSKNCSNSEGCFPDISYSGLNGGDVENFNSNATEGKMQLADGTLIDFGVYDNSCKRNLGSDNLQYGCAEIRVDTNGFKKPNTVGKDLFYFGLFKNGIYPYGLPNYTYNGAIFDQQCNSPAAYGYACTAWVLYNENEDYLHCSGLSWTGKTKCD